MDPALVTDDSQLIPRDGRLQLLPAATRRVGATLYVGRGGASEPVRRLDGAGPDLWAAFARGLTVAEAAAAVALHGSADLRDVERVVQIFATELVDSGLAVLAC